MKERYVDGDFYSESDFITSSLVYRQIEACLITEYCDNNNIVIILR